MTAEGDCVYEELVHKESLETGREAFVPTPGSQYCDTCQARVPVANMAGFTGGVVKPEACKRRSSTLSTRT